MIEIVLRKDIADFEPKPFFGFTARQVVTAVAAVVVSACAFAVFRFALSAPPTICGYASLAGGAAVGAVGLGKVRGLRAESWLRLMLYERSFPRTLAYKRPVLAGAPTSPYEGPKPKPTRADRRALKAERCEFTPKDMEA